MNQTHRKAERVRWGTEKRGRQKLIPGMPMKFSILALYRDVAVSG